MYSADDPCRTVRVHPGSRVEIESTNLVIEKLDPRRLRTLQDCSNVRLMRRASFLWLLFEAALRTADPSS